MPFAAKGTTLAWGSNTVALLKSIGSPEMTVEMLDATTHQSGTGCKEFIGGLIDWGDVPVTGEIDQTDTDGQVAMVTDARNRTMREVVITPPNSIFTLTFNALISAIKFGDFPHEGLIPFSATLKVTGDVTLAIAASTGLTTPFFALSGSGVLTPAAAGDKYEYTYALPNGTTSLTVTPTATAGVITVNGNVVATGVASSAISVPTTGITKITIVVTETGKQPKTYVIWATQEPS